MAHKRRQQPGPWPAVAALLAAWALASPAAAQTFDAGSDGSDGALVITANTQIQLPDDGILNYTTVQVDSGATLSFLPNPLNTPVYILASGDVTIDGTISVNGRAGTATVAGQGGPGGFRGGVPNPIGGGVGGAGLGPGAGGGRATGSCAQVHPGGYGSVGLSYSSWNVISGPTYGGGLLIPLVGGSGSGGGTQIGGGGGGGAILIASNTGIYVNGTISAAGGRAGPGGNCIAGSSGAIRLVATRVTGSGTVTAPRVGYYTFGGGGRVRIDRLVQSEVLPTVSSGHWVSSSLMLVFPDTLSQLDVTHVAGTDIPVGQATPVTVFLSNGQSSTQQVTVRAQGFPPGSDVNISVVLAPTLGARTTTPGVIPIGGDGTGTLSMQVEFPVNVVTHVQVWTSN